jgi:hypothetical protein
MVKRYEAGLNGTAYMGMFEHPDGKYVLFTDYEALSQQNAVLRKLLTEVIAQQLSAGSINTDLGCRIEDALSDAGE